LFLVIFNVSGLPPHSYDEISPTQQPCNSFLAQDETERLFAAITTKRDRALFLTAYRYGISS